MGVGRAKDRCRGTVAGGLLWFAVVVVGCSSRVAYYRIRYIPYCSQAAVIPLTCSVSSIIVLSAAVSNCE
jgi:hypothetical protein